MKRFLESCPVFRVKKTGFGHGCAFRSEAKSVVKYIVLHIGKAGVQNPGKCTGGAGGSVNKIESYAVISASENASIIIKEGSVGAGGSGGYGGAVGAPGSAELTRDHFSNGTDNSYNKADDGAKGTVVNNSINTINPTQPLNPEIEATQLGKLK